MATINIPIEELVSVLRLNLASVAVINSLDATDRGPRLGVRVNPLFPTTYIIVRFVKFENSMAYFSLDGLPRMVNLDNFLKLPEGIAVSGSQLTVDCDTLIRTQLHISGLKVKNFVWENKSYTIYLGAGRG